MSPLSTIDRTLPDSIGSNPGRDRGEFLQLDPRDVSVDSVGTWNHERASLVPETPRFPCPLPGSLGLRAFDYQGCKTIQTIGELCCVQAPSVIGRTRWITNGISCFMRTRSAKSSKERNPSPGDGADIFGVGGTLLFTARGLIGRKRIRNPGGPLRSGSHLSYGLMRRYGPLAPKGG